MIWVIVEYIKCAIETPMGMQKKTNKQMNK